MDEDIRELYKRGCRLSRAQFADWLGVTPATVKRWETGQSTPPKAVKLILNYFAKKRILTDEWANWSVINGELVNPAGESMTPGECQAYMFLRRNGVMQVKLPGLTRQATTENTTNNSAELVTLFP